ncbi:putative autotransporter [Pandoraea aquatica]|uniref:Putative autotransporter n=1 Tax=Pandoraea aquatica TaxID=2508290 RepID=A0A5E4X5I2_9BURK|nr:autotransporter outer membrane beta-barrel domain-containing protein [Pandoraea aquatica]VVE31546.1 putative autotransporter [Pandoraea aquatica]
MRTTSQRRDAASPHSPASSSLFPSRIAQGVALLLACLSVTAQARIISDGGEHTLDAPGDPSETWVVNNGSQLTVNPGTETNWIRVNENSHLNLDGVRVHGTVGMNGGLALENSTAIVRNSHISSENGVGLWLGTGGQNVKPSGASVFNSTITGVGFGVHLGRSASLLLKDSHIRATPRPNPNGEKTAGVYSRDSEVHIFGGSVTGDHGIWLSSGVSRDESRAVLNGTHIEGTDGPGILIQADPVDREGKKVVLEIENGTTITGSNGVLIELRDGLDSTVSVDNSQLTGDIVSDGSATLDLTLQNYGSITGKLIGVDSLAVNSNGKWALTADQEMAKITMDGGFIDIHGTAAAGTFHTLDVADLSGNGTFQMQADLQLGGADLLDVENATGEHQLHVKNTGTEGGVETQLLVEQGAGDGTFSLVGDKVDAGVYSYVLKSTGDAGGEQSWYLEKTEELTPGTDATVNIHNALPTAWLGEHTVLRQRLGEVRLGEGDEGGTWARVFGSKYNARPAAGTGYNQNQWGVIGGSDAVVARNDAGRWLVGGMFGTSTSRLKFNNGSNGTIESHTVGAYATWLGNNGYYFDGVLKYNHFGSELDVRMSDGTRSKGDFNNHGVGLSAEVGRKIEFGNRWFIEPFGQVAGMWASGTDFTLDNGMHAETSSTKSLLGTVGMHFGQTFETSKGTFQPYGKVAVTHEFVRSNSVRVNGIDLQQDISGRRRVRRIRSRRHRLRHLAWQRGRDSRLCAPVARHASLSTTRSFPAPCGRFERRCGRRRHGRRTGFSLRRWRWECRGVPRVGVVPICVGFAEVRRRTRNTEGRVDGRHTRVAACRSLHRESVGRAPTHRRDVRKSRSPVRASWRADSQTRRGVSHRWPLGGGLPHRSRYADARCTWPHQRDHCRPAGGPLGHAVRGGRCDSAARKH